MTELITQNQQPMMSSREIADLTGKKHHHVIRDIEKMLCDLEIYYPEMDNHEFKGFFIHRGVFRGRRVIESIDLDQDLTMTLTMGYKVQLRHKIAKRWRELEAGTALPDQSSINRKQLALMVIEAEERAEAFLIENKQLNATVESLEKRFRKGMTITSFCKSLNGVNVSKVMSWASERNWVFNSRRDQGKSPKWRVASYARDKYLTEEETQITPHGMDEFTKFTPVLLEKGCQRLFQLYMKGELPMKKTWNDEYSHDKAIYTAEAK